MVVDDSTVMPYEVSFKDGEIINTLKTVSLFVYKDWSDFGNRYGARPERIELVFTETHTGFQYSPTMTPTEEQAKGHVWAVEYQGLPAYVRVGNAYVKAEYEVTELTVDEYKADFTKAAGTAENGYKAIITNTLNSDVIGKATLTKYGSKEGGPKLAGAVYRLARLKDEKSGWPLLTPKPSEDSPIEYYAGEKDKKYRLMDTSARYSNRDGAALRFVAEQMSKRTEEVKLLILVSDGQPAAFGYSGTAAEENLRGIKQEYRRKGVHALRHAFVSRALQNGVDDRTVRGMLGLLSKGSAGKTYSLTSVAQNEVMQTMANILE